MFELKCGCGSELVIRDSREKKWGESPSDFCDRMKWMDARVADFRKDHEVCISGSKLLMESEAWRNVHGDHERKDCSHEDLLKLTEGIASTLKAGLQIKEPPVSG
jgi:hypothetical protein